jgi:hypothetical protein
MNAIFRLRVRPQRGIFERRQETIWNLQRYDEERDRARRRYRRGVDGHSSAATRAAGDADRSQGAGSRTSFGNAGLIQREGVVPYGFPQQIGVLMRYAFNNRIDAHYHLKALPGQLSFLARYWWNSNTKRHEMISKAYAPLIEHSIAEHHDLIEASHAEHLIRKNGWMEMFRTAEAGCGICRSGAAAEGIRRRLRAAQRQRSGAAGARSQPRLRRRLKWRDPWSVLDPQALTAAYRRYFESIGGRFAIGDANSFGKVRLRLEDGATMTARSRPTRR